MGFSSQLSQPTNHTEWVSLVFPSPREFNGVILYPRNDPGNVGEGFPVDFKIQVWTGSSWVDRVTVTGYSKPGNTPQMFSWPGLDTADIVRVYATSLRPIGPHYYLQLAEMAVVNTNTPNIAVGGIVSASSSYSGSPGWNKARIADGTTTSIANGMGHSSQLGIQSNHTEWVTIKFPTIRTLSEVALYPRSDAGNIGEGFPIDFKIQVWNGTSWIDRVSVTDYPKPTHTPQVFNWGFHDSTDRIRIYATKLRTLGVDYVLQLSEVSATDNVVVPNNAAGAIVSSSSSYVGSPGWSPASVADSLTSSVPGSMGYSSQLFQYSNHVEWITLDLPQISSFSGVALHPRNDAGMIGDGYPIDFKIQVWDGANWLDRVTRTGTAKPGDSAQVFRWGAADTTNRVRIHASTLRPVGSDYLLQLAEFRLLP
jgi:hypothetical protein